LEDGPAATVSRFGVAALQAGLAGLARVHPYNGDASPCSLVFDEPDELPEGPGMQHPVHLAGCLDAFPDAAQLLQGNNRIWQFLCMQDNGSANLVRNSHVPAVFLAQRTPQQIQPLRALEGVTAVEESVPAGLDEPAREKPVQLAIRRGYDSQMGNAQIHTDD